MRRTPAARTASTIARGSSPHRRRRSAERAHRPRPVRASGPPDRPGPPTHAVRPPPRAAVARLPSPAHPRQQRLHERASDISGGSGYNDHVCLPVRFPWCSVTILEAKLATFWPVSEAESTRMRADRLVAVLLFPASARPSDRGGGGGRAGGVGADRPARLEALSTAGIPVYSQAGRGGGWALVGGARTDLTGLTAGESGHCSWPRALLRNTRTRAALRKLVRACLRPCAPTPRRPRRRAWPTPRTGPGPPSLRTHPTSRRSSVQSSTGCRYGSDTSGREGPPGSVRSIRSASRPRRAPAISSRGPNTVCGRSGSAVSPRSGRQASASSARRVLISHGLACSGLTDGGPDAGRDGCGRGPARARSRSWRLFGGRLRTGRTLSDGWTEIEVDGPSPEIVAAQLAGSERASRYWSPGSRERLARLAYELASLYGPPAG